MCHVQQLPFYLIQTLYIGGEHMNISDKLAFEIYTISLFHIFAVLLVAGFTFYLFLKSKKAPLLYSYLAVVGMLLIWMISKILKTVSPNESIRWFFIVTQYIGIDFLGFFLILFANLYTKGKLPKTFTIVLLAIPPVFGFLAVLTNPLHMGFYAYYDFYKDSFGPLFFPSQIFQYVYLFSGIGILAKGFTNQPAFLGNRRLGHLFAWIVFIPILGNIYYLLIKLTDVPWIFHFPFFDFTPITSSIALVLFMIPAIKFRFMDISNIAYRHIFQTLPTGIIFYSADGHFYGYNDTFKVQFPHILQTNTLSDFITGLTLQQPNSKEELIDFLLHSSSEDTSILLVLLEGQTYKISKKTNSSQHTCLFITDLTPQARLTNQLESTHVLLKETNMKLAALSQSTKELALTRTQTKIAQDIHDILGHSLTVVIGTADLASKSTTRAEADDKLRQIKELLLSSLTDLKNSLEGRSLNLGHTSLIRAITSLKNDSIQLDFTVQGTPCELDSAKTETIYRATQEAMTNAIKHGHSKTLHCILRYKSNEIELFLIDDGIGCKEIHKNIGLTGMETRVSALGGHITFGANTQTEASTGFHIHIQLPL